MRINLIITDNREGSQSALPVVAHALIDSIGPEATIGLLKTRIQEELNIPTYEQSLVFRACLRRHAAQ